MKYGSGRRGTVPGSFGRTPWSVPPFALYHLSFGYPFVTGHGGTVSRDEQWMMKDIFEYERKKDLSHTMEHGGLTVMWRSIVRSSEVQIRFGGSRRGCKVATLRGPVVDYDLLDGWS